MNFLKASLLYVLITSLLISCGTYNKLVSFDTIITNQSNFSKDFFTNAEFSTCTKEENHWFNAVRLNNNQWGSNRVKTGKLRLCTYKKDSMFGWTWQSPKNAKGVIGYPAILIGHAPWNWQNRTIENFPIPINQIKQLVFDYDIESVVLNRKYNLSFDLWLSSQLETNTKTIVHEIMVWEDYNNFKPHGKIIDKIQTKFGEYTVYHGVMKKKELDTQWKFTAFVRTNKTLTNTVDLGLFLDYMITNKLLKSSEFLTSIELGNEFGNSSGYTIIKDLSLQFNNTIIKP